jgi:hypothetical protein
VQNSAKPASHDRYARIFTHSDSRRAIKDLPQSDALDREAMRSIVGGAATGARPVQVDQIEASKGRIIDYPPGFSRQGPLPKVSS